jgi:ATP-dependent Clp protease ATP-binding subunit ClpA
MKAFKKYIESILESAGREAQLDRSKTIEAQHVLLAMAAQPQSMPGEVLESAGLDRGKLREALEREFEQSLGAAGVSAARFGLPRSENGPEAVTDLGISVRHALERGVSGVRKHPQPAHLLLGILQAEVGTVPRALALVGVDRAQLMLRVQHKLDALPVEP